jgi:simple sugar transport system permease protein
MLNAIAGGLGAWLLLEHLAKPTTAADLTTSTPDLPDSANFPALVHKSATSPEDLSGFLIVAIFIGIAFYLLVWRTRFGYNLRASGTNFHAARVAGVNPGAMIVKTMLISGGLAGLVGMPHLLSFSHAYTLDFPTGLGFTGIAVALVGRNNPVGIAVAAVLFGFIERSAQILDFNGVPKEIFLIMEGVIILTVVIAYELVRRFAERQEVKAAAEQTRRLAAERAAAGEPEEATV